jgi:hypothetical protein
VAAYDDGVAGSIDGGVEQLFRVDACCLGSEFLFGNIDANNVSKLQREIEKSRANLRQDGRAALEVSRELR